MNRSFHFVAIKVIWSSEDDRGRGSGLRTSNQNEFIVANPLLTDRSGLAQHRSLERLLALQIGQRRQKLSASCLRNSLQIRLFAPKNIKFNICIQILIKIILNKKENLLKLRLNETKRALKILLL